VKNNGISVRKLLAVSNKKYTDPLYNGHGINKEQGSSMESKALKKYK
jgi:hypothetical protein